MERMLTQTRGSLLAVIQRRQLTRQNELGGLNLCWKFGCSVKQRHF